MDLVQTDIAEFEADYLPAPDRSESLAERWREPRWPDGLLGFGSYLKYVLGRGLAIMGDARADPVGFAGREARPERISHRKSD